MKKIISLLLALTMVVCSFSVVFADDSVVEIATAEDLIAVATTVAENGGEGITFKLTADIDFGGAEWNSYIGSYAKPFVGTFDGNGHVIKNYNLVIPVSDGTPEFQAAAALFRYVSGDAVIKDLGVENIVVSSANNSWRECAGGIVGTLDGNAKVSGCYVKNMENTDHAQPELKAIGGIAAAAISDGVVVENCYTIEMKEFENGGDSDGGVIGGAFQFAKIENCYSTATISRVPDTHKDKIVNCYYESPAPWPHNDPDLAESYPGNKIDEGAIKDLAESLGAAYTADSADFPSNDGYPILSWQVNTKLLEGDATIESSTPVSGAEEVNFVGVEANIVFDKMLSAADIDEATVLVDNDASYEVIVADSDYVDTITVKFAELELNSTYTISFTDAITTFAGDKIAEGETVSFTTIKSLPAFEVVETTPADNAKKVPYKATKLEAVYSLPVNADTLSEEDITVSPAADFEVDLVDETTVVVTFTEALTPNTVYEVTFGADIKSTFNTDADEITVSFKTDLLFGNMVENPGMESADLTQYGDRHSGNAMGTEQQELLGKADNKVLYLNPAWNDHPIELLNTTLEPGTYLFGAWVMSPEAQEINFSISDEAEYWLGDHANLKAGEWLYKSVVFNVTIPVKQVSIRSISGKKLYIDDWCLYDLSKAPVAATSLVSSSIVDGATNVSPYNQKLDLTFSSEVRVDSIIEQLKDLSVVENFAYDPADTSKVTVNFKTLEQGKSYTFNFDKIVDIKGNNVIADAITFNTFAAPSADAKVVSTTPAKDATGISKKGLVIKVAFDTPLEESTISNITVTPDIGAKPAIIDGNLTEVVIAVDDAKVEFGKKYTVNVPGSVKTNGGEFGTVPYEFSFTTIAEEDIAAVINGAIGDKAAMKSAIEAVYNELPVASGCYEYVLNDIPVKTDEMYQKLSEISEIKSVEDLQFTLNSIAFDIVLNNVSDVNAVVALLKESEGLLDEGVQTILAKYVDAEAQKEIAEAALSMKDKSFDEIIDGLVLEIAKEAFAVAGPVTAGELLELISDSLTGTDAIDALLEKVEDSKYTSKILAEMQTLVINDLSDIKDALQEAYDKYESDDDEDEDEDRGNGGGGGGGAGPVRQPGQGAAGFIPVMPDTTVDTDYVAIFSDLNDVEWARTSIDNLYAKGIINGKAEGIYDPNGLVTRKEFAKIAVLAVDGYDANATVDFVDLSKDDWSYAYVASACKLGLMQGIGDGKFGGDLYITREEMATILYRMATNEGLKLTEQVLFFTDEIEIADFAKEAVKVLSSNGIVNGTGDGKFEPKGNATRAQAAVIFDRFLAKLDK